MPKSLLPVVFIMMLFGLACSKPQDNANLVSNSNSNNRTTNNANDNSQSRTTPQRLLTPGTFLIFTPVTGIEGTVVKVDFDRIVRIDFIQNGTQAELFTVENAQLTTLFQNVIDPSSIKRLRDIVNDSAGHWVHVRNGPGGGDSQDSWVDLEKVTIVVFAHLQDGDICRLSAQRVLLGEVHIPAELDKVKRFIGVK